MGSREHAPGKRKSNQQKQQLMTMVNNSDDSDDDSLANAHGNCNNQRLCLLTFALLSSSSDLRGNVFCSCLYWAAVPEIRKSPIFQRTSGPLYMTKAMT